MNTCKICSGSIISSVSGWLICIICKSYIHITCTKRQTTPGSIYGDVFYEFTCEICSQTGTEIFVREKNSWFLTIFLVMYHYHHKSSGSAKRGFFHWRHHIVTYIERNWNILFPKEFKRKRNWIGAISSTLSLYSPFFFSSGARELNETGWWCLTFPKLIPRLVSVISAKLIATKQMKNMKFEKHIDNITDIERIKSMLKSYVPDDLKESSETFFKTNAEISLGSKITFEPKQETAFAWSVALNCDDKDVDVEYLTNSWSKQDETKSSLFTNELQTAGLGDAEQVSMFSSDSVDNSSVSTENIEPEDSLFQPVCKMTFCDFWKECVVVPVQFKCDGIVPLRPPEEAMLIHRLTGTNNCASRRLLRKLLVRQQKRRKFLAPFNIDEKFGRGRVESDLDVRFRHYGNGSVTEAIKDLRMINACEKATKCSIVSPFTRRWLKPYIWRSKVSTALWPKVLTELLNRVGHDLSEKHYMLDFCYVKPCHIPVVNSLCECFFWPGIDLADTLEYPDFSCVVLYKKIVVAFAFMVPDVKLNEAYISFVFTRPEWRGAGIAKFMIYHLVQTCQGKDITLHVAIDNPAVHLYQKFGFKVEEIIYNFYDMYIRDDDKQSKHAFFLRLQR